MVTRRVKRGRFGAKGGCVKAALTVLESRIQKLLGSKREQASLPFNPHNPLSKSLNSFDADFAGTQCSYSAIPDLPEDRFH